MPDAKNSKSVPDAVNSKPVFNLIFWFRALLGLFTGTFSGILGFTSVSESANLGLFFAITMYLFSIALVRNFYSTKINKDERWKLFTTGIGTFIGLFLFFWILYDTLFVINL